MKNIIHFFNVILCLAVLLLPMQNIVAQNNGEMDCCKTEQSKDCCDSDSSKKDNRHQKECNDCCATSHTCASCFIFIFKNSTLEESCEFNFTEQTQNFTYTPPFFESLEDSIWQPPKIA